MGGSGNQHQLHCPRLHGYRDEHSPAGRFNAQPADHGTHTTGRWGKPEDMAGTVIHLASNVSDYVNGSIIVVDGGWMGR